MSKLASNEVGDYLKYVEPALLPRERIRVDESEAFKQQEEIDSL